MNAWMKQKQMPIWQTIIGGWWMFPLLCLSGFYFLLEMNEAVNMGNELKITNQMEFKRWWLPNGWIALPSMVNCNRKLSGANIPWKMVRITKIGANNLLDKPKMVFLSRAIHYFWFNLFVHNLCAHCFVHQSTYTCQINYCWIDGEFMKCFLDCIRTEKRVAISSWTVIGTM